MWEHIFLPEVTVFCRLCVFKWNFESLFLTNICSYNDKCIMCYDTVKIQCSS